MGRERLEGIQVIKIDLGVIKIEMSFEEALTLGFFAAIAAAAMDEQRGKLK